MAVEKQRTVKSELSPDGGLKLTIKREKTVEDVCKPEWVTEARGNGLGKLVFKRKSPGSASQSLKTTGLHVDRQTEQRHILRLSLTPSASSGGNRHAQVKSWSLCEVSSVVEDVASASELSPACQLQPSPKDSGIDMSSPPHDDGAVGVEPNAVIGIWGATDSHTGDSSAVDVEKMASSLAKSETTVASFDHANSTVHSGCKALWPETASRSCENNEPKVQSTLRSRRERSAIKSFASNSQKLVNPLAKPRRVGRYQHMLPVHRIREESNAARRSSLEESPTYNMLSSRSSLFSQLPRVKTKLKLLSNNTYAPVFDQEMESTEQHAAAQKSKHLNVEKSSSAVVEYKRNRVSHKSSAADVFKNLKVKFCFSGKNHRSSVEDDKVQKLPKLKLVVKSEPALSVSCVEQRLEDSAVTAVLKEADENTPGHSRRRRRHHEIAQIKAPGNNASTDSLHTTDGFNESHMPSFSAADVRSCHSKRKNLEAKQVVDCESPSGKKSKLRNSTEQLVSQSLVSSDSKQSFEGHVDNAGIITVESAHCKMPADEAVCDVVMTSSSVHTDKLSASHSSPCDASSKPHTAVPEETGKSDSTIVDQTTSAAISRRHCEIGKIKASGNNASMDSLHTTDGFNTNHLLSFEAANVRSCRPKCKNLEAKQVVDCESPSGKKSKLQSSTKQLASHLPVLSDAKHSVSDSKQLFEGHVDNAGIITVESAHCKTPVDEAVCDVVMNSSSVHTDKLSASHSSPCDTSSKPRAAVPEEAGKSDSTVIDQTTSPTVSRRRREIAETEACSNKVSTDSFHTTNGFNGNHLPSFRAANIRSGHPKRKNLEAKQVVDCESPSGMKSKLRNSTEQLVSQSPMLSDSKQSFEGHVDNVGIITVESAHCKMPADEAVCDVVMTSSSVHTDKLSASHSSPCDASSKPHTAVPEETGKSDSTIVDQTTSPAISRRHCEIGKIKASGNNASMDSLRTTDGFNTNHLLSFEAANVRSCRPKCKNLEAKQVVDCESPSGKKSKLQSSTKQLASHLPVLSDAKHSVSDSKQSFEDHVDNAGIITVESVHCKMPADEAVCDVVMSSSSVHTEKLSASHSSLCDASSNPHTAVMEEAGKSDSIVIDQTTSAAISQRCCEIGKIKASGNSASVDSLHTTDGFNTNHLLSFEAANVRSCRPKCKNLVAKSVVDCKSPPGKKNKLRSSTKQLTSHLPMLSDAKHLFEEDLIDNAGIISVESVHCQLPADEAVCDVVMTSSSVHTDKLSASHSSLCDAYSKPHTAVPEEAGKPDSIVVDQTTSPAIAAESVSNTTGANHGSSIEIDKEKHCSEGSDFDNEKYAVLNVNADCDRSGVDCQRREKLSVHDGSVDVMSEEMLTAVQRDVDSDCSTALDEETLVANEPSVTITSAHADDRLKDTLSDQLENRQSTCAVSAENSMTVNAEQPTIVCTDNIVPLLSSPPLINNNSVTHDTDYTDSGPVSLRDSNGTDIDKAQDSSLSSALKPAVVAEDISCCVTVDSQNNIDLVNKLYPVDPAKPDFRDTQCHQDVKQQVVNTKEFCEKKIELKSVSLVSEQEQKLGECEKMDSDPAYSFHVPSHLMPLSAPCYSKEHKEAAVANSACSNGFLAAFTQFVNKVSLKKKSGSCRVIETDNTAESAKDILLKPGYSQKCVRKRPFTSQKRRRTCSEDPSSTHSRLLCDVAHSESISTVVCVPGKEESLLGTGTSEDIDCIKRLTSTSVDDERSTLCREELVNVVCSDRQLVMLRHRVCELIETVLPELRFPFGFQRDTASVERFLKDIIDMLLNSEAHIQDIQKCSDPVVTLHHMPDRCLQSLQQQVLRLLSLLLPDTDLSEVNGDSLDVFLELMTSINRPLPSTFCVSEPNLHLSQETNYLPSDKLPLQRQPLSLCGSDTNVECEPVDTLVSRTESCVFSVDTMFNMPSSLPQINTPGPIGDKRSIRRQVKDCLMFLDRDLT